MCRNPTTKRPSTPCSRLSKESISQGELLKKPNGSHLFVSIRKPIFLHALTSMSLLRTRSREYSQKQKIDKRRSTSRLNQASLMLSTELRHSLTFIIRSQLTNSPKKSAWARRRECKPSTTSETVCLSPVLATRCTKPQSISLDSSRKVAL